jgi:O-methyltransferase involved in polyketide biosynthesis
MATPGGSAPRLRVSLGEVQQTLLIPLAARARETQRRHPVLRDPKAVAMMQAVEFDAARSGRGTGGQLTVLRTAILDLWVSQFLADNPGGTVAEIGTGLNTRFDRVDNGTASWIDLDLPDTIALRRQFFEDTGRRQMVAASFLDEDWLDIIAARPGPYFFVAEGVLVYLPRDQVTAALARIARRFPGARIALDTYPQRSLDRQHQLAARRHLARWAWACDDPRELERLGLHVTAEATAARLPGELRRRLPARYRLLLPLAGPVLGGFMTLTLFTARRRR